MGTDKALLSLGNRTLLDRASFLLATVCSDVTIVGRQHPTIRNIPDAATHIGPIGGVTAGLADLAARRASWAFFLPVDVPLLPPCLAQALLNLWLSNPLTSVAFPIADHPQPVICLVHVSALPAFLQAVSVQQHRLRLVLEAAAKPGALTPTPLAFHSGTLLAEDQPLSWQPTGAARRLQPFWFSNCNTPADLAELQTAIAREGDLY